VEDIAVKRYIEVSDAAGELNMLNNFKAGGYVPCNPCTLL
jgi:hypothetical protein